ncbi:unnamed protein product [Vicia faba]|uniref:ADP-ribosyl cyclase/cyclic ADP-ribose hydrolase n=1 Tax=Vicia faba TaxID=3906 RepID=A0AAV0ZM26_VICFA|nr:unnamed protein product [Vicia faba]
MRNSSRGCAMKLLEKMMSITDPITDLVLLSVKALFPPPFRAVLGCFSFFNMGHRGTASSGPPIDSDHINSYKYDVFISFSGADTRNTFVDHLYAHLTRKGIFAFKDDIRLQNGESLSP